MTTRIIVAAAVLFLIRPSVATCAGEHPEYPQSPPASQPSDQTKPAANKPEKKEVTTAQISTGIKKHITAGDRQIQRQEVSRQTPGQGPRARSGQSAR